MCIDECNVKFCSKKGLETKKLFTSQIKRREVRTGQKLQRPFFGLILLSCPQFSSVYFLQETCNVKLKIENENFDDLKELVSNVQLKL